MPNYACEVNILFQGFSWRDTGISLCAETQREVIAEHKSH